MPVLTSSFFIDFVLFFLPIIFLLKYYFNLKYKYWQDRGVPFIKPVFPFGSFGSQIISGKKCATELINQAYNEMKDNKICGYYELHVPKLMILDPDLIYQILVKDFAHFHDRGLFPVDVDRDPLTNNISVLDGARWRHLRYKLSPVFTTGKLKGMFEQIYNCGEELLQELDKYADEHKALEAKDVCTIFTIEVIASCAFGMQIKINNPEGQPFKEMVKKAFPTSKYIMIINLVQNVYTAFSKVLGIRTFKKDVTEYFVNLSKSTVKFRREKRIKRNDFLQLLMDLKEREDNDTEEHVDEENNEEDDIVNQLKNASVFSPQLQNTKVMTEEGLAAASFMFLVAGSEVSTALGLLLFDVASNPEVQVGLQREVDEVVKKHGGYNYQAIKDMQYMDEVIQESFRMHPITGYLNRVCTVPYRLPGTETVIESGTSVVIPVWAMQNDPRHYPDPSRFDPSRFTGHNFKPSPTYLPFGDGPRICIAMRFAILEVKVCLAKIMSRFHLGLSDRMDRSLRLDPHWLFPRVLGGVWLTVQRRTPS